MAVSNPDGSQTADVTPAEEIRSRLRDEPGIFSWQQAIRILEERIDAGESQLFPPGFTNPPEQETPRLCVSPDMNHAYADVAGFIPGEANNIDSLTLSLSDASRRYTLLGAHGVMPSWYSELALERKDAGDSTLIEFLSMFEHRLLSLAYRGWWHHRLEFRREKSLQRQTLPDMDRWFDSLAGLGTSGQSERLHKSTTWLIRCFAPMFANVARPASGLAALLSAYSGTGVSIREMVVRWCQLDGNDRNSLPAEINGFGRNCSLGRDLILGERVPEAQGNYNIVLGRMSWTMFCSFLPGHGSAMLEGVCELARLFAGSDRSFGVRLLLADGEMRGVCLGGQDTDAAYLGWNVWLATEDTTHMDRTVGDAFFAFGESVD